MTPPAGAPGTAGEHYRAEPGATSWLTTHGDIVTRNNEIVGQGEGHTRKAGAVEAAERHHPRVEQSTTDEAADQ